MKKVLVTGAAGFIGSALCEKLIAEKCQVVGVDNLNNLYSPSLKEQNISQLFKAKHFRFYRDDVTDLVKTMAIFKTEEPDIVVHIAGVTGMANSLQYPNFFFENNVIGTQRIGEACIAVKVNQLIYLSTSTIYGNKENCSEDVSPEILNPYAFTKKKGEEITHFYYSFYGLCVTILRLFTVYGPRQRPTMAISKFVKNAFDEIPLTVFGDGSSTRDYLYIDDCIDAILKSMSFNEGFEIFNVGSGHSYSINRTIKIIQDNLRKLLKITNIETPEVIPENSKANIEKASLLLGFSPKMKFEEGIKNYIKWYNHYYKNL